MAKEPVPGTVKTRLCPPLSPDEAAAVAGAALADTFAAVAACSAERRVVALAGSPGPWLPPGFEVIHQRGASFGERLANAWADVGGPGVQIGMDTPQVTAADLDALLPLVGRPGASGPGVAQPALGRTAAQGRLGRTAVLGPAQDGGWWVIGWDGGDAAAVFDGVPMSTGQTGRAQLRRLRRLGFLVVPAPVRRDIDTIADLWAVASAAPALETAGVARALGVGELVA
jgi:glycosyltransferase A (GT-A) superfamily protein (DUF2064 family)